MSSTRIDSPSLDFTAGGYYVCTPKWTTHSIEIVQEQRIYFALKGEAFVLLDGKPYAIRGGNICFIPAHYPSRNLCNGRLTLYWMHFKPQSLYLDLLLSRVQGVHVWKASRWAAWKQIYSQMPSLMREKPTELYLQAHAMMLAMLSDMIRALELEKGLADLDVAMRTFWPAVQFMDENFKRNPSLDEVAARVFLSPVYFHRRFTQLFHVTPHDYMLRKRMNLARNLLYGTPSSVQEVARQCGYENSFYFSRTFKKFFKQSPLQMRRAGVPEKP